MVLQHSGQTLIHELLLKSLYAFSIRISRLAASASHVSAVTHLIPRPLPIGIVLLQLSSCVVGL